MIVLHADKNKFTSLAHNKVSVEVGVFKGRYALELLKMLPKSLTLIDPYDPDAYGSLIPEDDPTNNAQETLDGVYGSYYVGGMKESLETAYKNLKQEIADHENGKLVKFLKLPSEEACEQFSDKSIDFLHLDANNRYDYVLGNLIRWEKKISDSGVIVIDNCYVTADAKLQHISTLEGLSSFLKLYDWIPVGLSTARWSNVVICKKVHENHFMSLIKKICIQNEVHFLEIPPQMLHSYHHKVEQFEDINGQINNYWTASFS